MYSKPFAGDILTTDGAELENMFVGFIGNPLAAMVYTLVFLSITVSIVIAGVQSGIERICKILMPVLFILMIFLAFRSLTLPGAIDGLIYLVTPDWSKLTVHMFLEALGLAVFSLSVGAGLMIAYGSYLGKGTKIVNSSLWIASLAILAAGCSQAL